MERGLALLRTPQQTTTVECKRLMLRKRDRHLSWLQAGCDSRAANFNTSSNQQRAPQVQHLHDHWSDTGAKEEGRLTTRRMEVKRRSARTEYELLPRPNPGCCMRVAKQRFCIRPLIQRRSSEAFVVRHISDSSPRSSIAAVTDLPLGLVVGLVAVEEDDPGFAELVMPLLQNVRVPAHHEFELVHD